MFLDHISHNLICTDQEDHRSGPNLKTYNISRLICWESNTLPSYWNTVFFPYLKSLSVSAAVSTSIVASGETAHCEIQRMLLNERHQHSKTAIDARYRGGFQSPVPTQQLAWLAYRRTQFRGLEKVLQTLFDSPKSNHLGKIIIYCFHWRDLANWPNVSNVILDRSVQAYIGQIWPLINGTICPHIEKI